MLQISVQDVKPGTQKHITASCSVMLTTPDGDEFITIVDVRVFRNRSGDLWISFPTQPVHDFEGIKYVPDMLFSKELKRRITEAVLAEFEKDDAQYVVRSEHQMPAVRPAVKPFRQALVGSGARGNNAR